MTIYVGTVEVICTVGVIEVCIAIGWEGAWVAIWVDKGVGCEVGLTEFVLIQVPKIPPATARMISGIATQYDFFMYPPLQINSQLGVFLMNMRRLDVAVRRSLLKQFNSE